MPVITKISDSAKRKNRKNIFLDGEFAFACATNVVARFRLRVGTDLTDAQVQEIHHGQTRQQCFDKAMAFLTRRLHSRSELARKLVRQEYSQSLVGEVLDDLARLGYVNDEQFALAKAQSALQRKQHGRRRAMAELLRAGVSPETARQSLDAVYDPTDSLAAARQLARKQAARLRKLDPQTARRRLAGMLQRRGFDYETIKPVIDEVLENEK